MRPALSTCQYRRRRSRRLCWNIFSYGYLAFTTHSSTRPGSQSVIMTLSPLQIESWTEFAVGFFIILVRAAYRTKVSGWKWHGDDYFAVAAGLFFAVRWMRADSKRPGTLTCYPCRASVSVSKSLVGFRCNTRPAEFKTDSTLLGHWGSIIGMTEEVALSLTDAQKVDVIKGSKANVAGWCLYISLIWCLKSCMLFFYARLTYVTVLYPNHRVTSWAIG